MMVASDENIVMRKGLPRDAAEFAGLMLLSAPHLLPAVYGSGVSRILQDMFLQRRNMFSFEHSYFVEVNGKKAGMALGYDWKTRGAEVWRTGLLTIKCMRLRFFTRILSLLRAMSLVAGVDDDEYYVSNIAVLPEFRGANLGTNLLLKMEEEARSRGAGKIVLDVAVDNQGAIRLYNRLGYSAVGKPKKARISQQAFAFVRMSKNCDANAG